MLTGIGSTVTVLMTITGAGGLPLVDSNGKTKVDAKLGVDSHIVTVTTAADTTSDRSKAIMAVKLKGRIVVDSKNEFIVQ